MPHPETPTPRYDSVMPAKPKLTPEVHDALVTAMRGGNYAKTAAEYAGISEATYYRWIAQGREALAHAETTGARTPTRDLPYVKLVEAVEKAAADAEVRNVALIQRAAGDDWRAAAWFLERTRRDRFGPVQRTELTGANGGAVEVTAESLEERIAALAVALGDSDPT